VMLKEVNWGRVEAAPITVFLQREENAKQLLNFFLGGGRVWFNYSKIFALRGGVDTLRT